MKQRTETHNLRCYKDPIDVPYDEKGFRIESSTRLVEIYKETVTYTQPFLNYWLYRAYHRLWCMQAYKFLGPIDNWRDKRKDKKSKNGFSIPTDAERDIKCYELSKKNRVVISTGPRIYIGSHTYKKKIRP